MQPAYDKPEIDAWIETHNAQMVAHPLSKISPAPAGTAVEKYGVLPMVVENGKLQVLLTEPESKRGGRPGFQLPKGTGRYWNETGGVDGKGAWEDVNRNGHKLNMITPETILETPLQAALREGREEAGLKYDNIRQLVDLGVVKVQSAKAMDEGRDEPVYIRLYAALVKDKRDFGPPEDDAAKRVAWWEAPTGFAPQHAEAPHDFIRSDHLGVVRQLPEHLAQLLGIDLGRPAIVAGK